MKMQKNILEKVRNYEYKRGISYEKVDGNVYKRLRICYYIAAAYTVFVNLLVVFGDVLFKTIEIYQPMQNKVAILTAVLVISIVLVTIFKKVWSHIALGVCNIGCSVWFCIIYSEVLRDEVDVLLDIFYYRHLVPLCILSLLAIGLVFIAIRAAVKTRSVYKRIEEELYKKNFNIEEGNLSESEWNALLKEI